MQFKSRGEYEKVKVAVMKDVEDGGVGVSMEVDTVTEEPFVFCLDPVTNELFDDLTDRPVTYQE